MNPQVKAVKASRASDEMQVSPTPKSMEQKSAGQKSAGQKLKRKLDSTDKPPASASDGKKRKQDDALSATSKPTSSKQTRPSTATTKGKKATQQTSSTKAAPTKSEDQECRFCLDGDGKWAGFDEYAYKPEFYTELCFECKDTVLKNSCRVCKQLCIDDEYMLPEREDMCRTCERKAFDRILLGYGVGDYL
ncbi:uncharacterized protein LY89DRAFT_755280 [Mollisia scopiformis]|uniref:Uncharacterized protein n=1 Tax=Mollisia scopiformis TaxID=149040 RepID=A0A194XUJ3_MOLSC|nr:uncharacterized protein LY89DRAFT_755280 [Mollisia scopiformis]KUJ23377.1 hypothetical protein LY89DRAFT_755280 [Mollisia scopiformis]